MHNLITDPIITLRLANETLSASLPLTLELLFEDAVLDFPALRPHQGPAWHAFLVQLAFLATEDGEVPMNAEGWAAALRGLTREWPQDEPWCLMAPAEAPAFLQSPAPGGDLRPYDKPIATPDELDPLVTSKNHDFKAARMRAAMPEEWMFALMTLQTTAGYSGRKNYGIMRMRNKWSSRPFLSISPNGNFGTRIKRDYNVLVRNRNLLYSKTPEFGRENRLIWLLPWDGNEALEIREVHPLAIEICRRIRLGLDKNGQIEAYFAGTENARIDDFNLRGATGDPWTPTENTDGTYQAIEIDKEGFMWRRLHDILFKFERPMLAKCFPDDGDSVEIVAAGLARTAHEKGRTNGFYLRRVPITNRFAVRALMDDGEERQRLAKLSEDFAIHAMTVADRCLEPALFILFRKGEIQKEKKKDFYKRKNTKEQVGPWMQRFDRLIDQTFFDRLWTGAESEEAARQALDAWGRWLHQAAFQVFDLAVEAAPRTDQRRIFAAARARDLLSGALRRHLPLSTTTPDQEAADAE